MKTHYSIRDFKRDFPTDEACLDLIFSTLHSRKCSCGGTYHLRKGRKQYQCSKCRFHIAPTAGTIFHKSDTPLTLWFHAIWVFSNAKSGISAKEMERQLGVTYKTAWRFLNLIRKALEQGVDKLKGDIEMDEAYFGGRKKAGKDNKRLGEALKAKGVMMGAFQRKGELRVKVTPDATSYSIDRFLDKNVEKDGTRLMTDASNRYKSVAYGFDRQMVNHSKKVFARGDVHINHIESFWAHIKRSIKGTHKVISKRYLQNYLDGFVFHYNNRGNDNVRFSALLGIVLRAAE